MFYDEDNVATLIIRDVFPEDAGTFTCVAKNAAGFASSTTELIVDSLSDQASDMTCLSRRSMSRESSLADILEGIPPIFSKKPRAKIVDEYSNVILECRLVAVPEPEITWSFNGKEINPETNKNIKVITESDMHTYCSILSIDNVKKNQEGVYKITAVNREGESTLTLKLKVKTQESELPEILEPLKNTITREGETIILSTQIVGNPVPVIEWFKNGKKITDGPTSEKDVYTYIIKSPTQDDSGEYTVKATNKTGTVQTKATVTVEGKLSCIFYYT